MNIVTDIAHIDLRYLGNHSALSGVHVKKNDTFKPGSDCVRCGPGANCARDKIERSRRCSVAGRQMETLAS